MKGVKRMEHERAEMPERKIRTETLEKAVAIYSHRWSEVPDMLRVSFADGRTAVYELRVEQPAPVIVENIKIIRKWKQGYVNQPEIRRRNRG